MSTQLRPGIDLTYGPTRAVADVSRFILNGLRHANRVLGETAFLEKDWRVIGEYVCDAEGGRHQAFYAPRRDTIVRGELIGPHERIHVEQSLKYSEAEAAELWKRAGMTEIGQWRHREEYGEYLYTTLLDAMGVAQRDMPPSQQPQLFPKSTPRFGDTWGQSYDSRV